jgi:hypothetical protein
MLKWFLLLAGTIKTSKSIIKGGLYTWATVNYLNHRFGLEEGIFTDSDEIPIFIGSPYSVGDIIAVGGKIFEELAPFVDKVITFTQSEGIKVHALTNTLKALLETSISIQGQEYAALLPQMTHNTHLAAQSLAAFLLYIPEVRIRDLHKDKRFHVNKGEA